MADRILRKAILRAEEDYADDQEVETAQSEAVEEASRRAQPLTAEQQRMLDDLRRWAQTAKNQPDSKAKAILDWLEANLKPDGQWNDRGSSSSPSTAPHISGCTRSSPATASVAIASACSTAAWTQEERENDQGSVPDLAQGFAGPHPAGHRCRIGRYRPAEPLQLPHPPRDPLQPQRDGAAQRPYRPSRAAAEGSRDLAPRRWRRTGRSTIGGHGDDIIRALRKLDSMRADMGSVNPVIAPQMSGLIEGSLKDLDTRLAEAKIAKARRFVRAERELKERIAKLHERLLDHAARFPPHARPHPHGGQDRPCAGRPSAARACRLG